MIVTLTLNPAVDKTSYIDPLVVGGLNRVKRYEVDAGGKGINVSKIVHMLGSDSVATGFVGGSNGKLFLSELVETSFKNEFIQVAGNTRVNLKLYDDLNGITEVNEEGVEVTKDEEQAVIEKLLSYANENSVIVLAGSLHGNASDDFYKKLTEMLKAKGATVFVDADDEAFTEAVKAGPDFIKPNIHELLRHFDKESATDEEILDMCKELIDSGVKNVVLSMGGDGALFVTKDECYKAEALKVKVESTVGAGDSMVGAFAYATDKKMSLEEAAILSIACSAGACTTTGTNPPTLELVNELKAKVVLQKLY